MNREKIFYRLFVTIAFLCGTITCFAQSGLGTNQCNGGDYKPFTDQSYRRTDALPSSDSTTQSSNPVDPNEIIGLDGYNAPESTDTLRWVSATQSLAYTIYFENDAELAMAEVSEIPLAHCVRGGMVRDADGRGGKRRAADESVPLLVTSFSPPFFFPFLSPGAAHHSAKRDSVERNLLRLATNLPKTQSDLKSMKPYMLKYDLFITDKMF